MIGVGGVSMRALAQFCIDAGKSVVGRDDSLDADLSDLVAQGMRLIADDCAPQWADCDLIVYSAAISARHPARVFAQAQGVECIERKLFLAQVARLFERTIAVAGSHGKTTVTSMIAHILQFAQVDFAAHIGGDAQMGRNHWLGGGRALFVTEACEYNRSFLELTPDVGVVLNCDYDHPDTYADEEENLKAFETFARQSTVRIMPVDCPLASLGGDTITYGICAGEINARNVRRGKRGYRFDWYDRACLRGTIDLPVEGLHNVLNALAACAVCTRCGLSAVACSRALESFRGVARRFQQLGKTRRGATVICDYAHHPKEIVCAIDSARARTRGKIVVLFEPHTYSRTLRLKERFADSFYWADELAILPTFAARETPSDGMDAKALAEYIGRRTTPPVWLQNDREAADFVDRAASANDLVLALGAGRIDRIAAQLVAGETSSQALTANIDDA